MSKVFFFLLCILIVLFSCGTRSGIYNDEETTEVTIPPEDTSAKHRNEVLLEKSLEKGKKLFKQNCAACHMSHTNNYITGPGLKGIFDRVPKPTDDWIIKYTLNNVKVFNSGDTYAKKLMLENKGAEMTIFEGQLTEDDIKEIIKFLKKQPEALHETILP